MTPRNRLITLTVALALTLTIAVAAVAAGGPSGVLAATGTPTAGTGQTNDRQNALADFYAKLAANLGIGQDKLVAAVNQTNQQQIDAAVAAGTMTQEQAQAARDRLANSTNGLPPFGIDGHGRGGQRGGGDKQVLQNAAATFFGITPAQFQQDLATAGSLQGVAAKYNKDNASGKAALQTAMASALRQDLTTKGVATAQIDQEVNEFTQNFDQFYTSTHQERQPRQQPGTSPNPSATPKP